LISKEVQQFKDQRDGKTQEAPVPSPTRRYHFLTRTSVFSGQQIEKKANEMPRIVDEEEITDGPSNFEEELQIRELKIAS
jgi:hypothetical protein